MEIQNKRNGTDHSTLLKQIENSNMVISDLIKDGIDMVLNVQVANDMREMKRREEEQNLRKSRVAFLEKEAKRAEAQFNEIYSKWDSVSKLNDSMDIYNALENQINKYKELIRQQDDIIDVLKKELVDADKRFMEAQEMQKEEIDILSDRINEHINIMKNAYRKHIGLIEDTAEKQYKMKLHKKHAEWLEANDAFKREGIEELDETFKIVEDHETYVQQMIWDHYEQYRSMKKNLETELQNQQIILEETKASCLINEKKLEYNYLILSKRREEIGQVKARQRRQINSLVDELNSLKIRKTESEKEHQSECKTLQNEISKLESTAKDLCQKKERLDNANENTFKQIWKLNEKRAKKLLDKILKTDQLLHEQILQIKWNPPNFSFMKISDLPSVQFAMRHIPDFQSSYVDASNTNREKSTEISLNDYPQLSSDFEVLKFILQNIAKNIKFVINNKLDVLTANLPEEKQSLVCFDNILKVLNLKNGSELELLKQQFSPFIRCSTCNNKTTSPPSKKLTFPCITHSKYGRAISAYKRTNSGSKLRQKSTITDMKRPASAPGRRRADLVTSSPRHRAICDNPQHTWHLDQFTVIKLLSEYMKDKKQREMREKNSEIQKIPLSRILSPQDIELYWSAFLFKSMNDCKNLWDIVLPSLHDHFKLKRDQKKLREEIKSLEKQNIELKRALRCFTERSTHCQLGGK